MSLIHDFFLCDKEHIDYRINHDGIEMDDDLIVYLSDSLEWIDTEWNELDNNKNGLNYFGMTIFRRESLSELVNIIKGWIEVFKNAPARFLLTVGYDIDSGLYEKKEFEKVKVLAQMTEVLEMCGRAQVSNKVLVHAGI